MPNFSYPLRVSTLVSLGAVLLGFLLETDPRSQILLATRWTGRLGLLILSVSYMASSLHTLWPNTLTRHLLQARRAWGIAFALSHTVHLCALSSYVLLTKEPQPLGVLLPGGFAFVLLYAMLFTSNDSAMRQLGPWWKRLHSFGTHYLWLVFATTYIGFLFDPIYWPNGIPLSALLLSGWGLRLAAWQKRRTLSLPPTLSATPQIR